MRTYRFGQPEDWLKIPDVNMLTHGYLNDAIQQSTGTILYIYQDKTLLAAQDVTQDIKQLLVQEDQKRGFINTNLETFEDHKGRNLVKGANYYVHTDLRIMLEHKVLEMLETKNK